MASRPKGYGFSAEVKSKIDSKYDLGRAQEAVDWIRAVTGEEISSPESGDVHASLKDGQILCKLINTLQPGSVKKINTSTMAFKQMENIGKFLEAVDNYGCVKTDLFQTVDLYENQNMGQVINGIHALGRKAQSKGFGGPTIGPKEAVENKREFTDEQLKAGQNVIGLQMGSNKGASQAGQSFGKTRQILD